MKLSVKLTGIAAAFAFALTVASPVSAQSVADLQALIASLQAQLNALSGTTTATSTTTFTYTRDLTLGSTGSDVVALQTFLESKGQLTMPAGVAKGYFGELTRAALARYQANHMITPAVGYFGPMTRAKVMAEGAITVPGTPGTPTVPGGLSGTEGDIEIDVTVDGDIQIDLGKSDVALEVELEAVDGDVEVDRIDFLFNKRPWLYFDEVNLLADGKEVASLSRSGDFTETNGKYRARFSGLKSVIREDDSTTYSLELVVLPSMQGDRQGETVVVEMTSDSIRYVDGSGAIMTAGEAADADVTFDDNFGEGEINVTIGDNSPERATIILSETSRTDGVTVLEFNVEADDSDIEIQNIEVEFDTNASSTAATVYRAYLYQGSKLLKSKAVTTDTVEFDDLDYMIDADDEETFTVKLDFNKADGIAIDKFTVVKVVVEAENSDFEEANDDLTVDEEHRLVVEGLVDDFIKTSASTSQLGDNTIATLVYEFDITAHENTFYIAENGTGFGFTRENASTTVVSKTIASTNATLVGNSYRINKGQTRTFKVEVKIESATGTQSTRGTLDDLDYYTNSDLDEGEDTLLLGAPEYRSSSVTVFKQ